MDAERIQVLDHGYVALVESWGSDERIIEAARMSTGKGFLGWGPTPCPGPRCTPIEHAGDLNFCEHVPRCDNGKLPGDEKLLRYLWTHQHHTPFEMAGLKVEVQAPIFVFREWHRHRTQSYNELSARYTPLPDENYRPTRARIISGTASAAGNKQASGTVPLDDDSVAAWLRRVDTAYAYAQEVYADGLAIGVLKEVARIVVPVGRYSRMQAQANLRNWLGFLALRLDPAAQWEIRQYAWAVARLVERLFPRTWELFAEGRQI